MERALARMDRMENFRERSLSQGSLPVNKAHAIPGVKNIPLRRDVFF
jgi:hypothetical protein